ncbi:hypothetical protein HDU81_005831 [Chytriomyces hyalinus]|nr:hypothetical protein HDU81_005831 [Chytriomyces hyalinus]
MNMIHSKSTGTESSTRTKTIPRLGAISCCKLRSRQGSNAALSSAKVAPEGVHPSRPVPPQPGVQQSLEPHATNNKPLPPRNSSLRSNTSTLTPTDNTHLRLPSQTEFHLLPIAPAAFERRRPSISPSPSTNASGLLPTSASALSTDDELVSPSSPVGVTNHTSWMGHRRKSSLSSVSSGVTMSRRSYSSFDKIQPRAEAEIKGVYGWTEEEAAHYNQEYVAFMKSKGVTIAV